MTVIYRPHQIDAVLEVLARGAPAALPTETVYGLAALAENPQALAKVFQLKARPHFDPLIVHVRGVQDAQSFAPAFKDLELKLMEHFWPGPLTLLVEKNSRIPDLCTADSSWVALRSPDHELFQKALEILAQPLAAPSANRFGQVSPTTASAVVEELGPYGLEAVLDGGPCRRGVESTLLRVVDEESIELRRPGALSVEEIDAFFLPRKIRWVSVQKNSSTVVSPGLLTSHYAPRTPLKFFEDSQMPTLALGQLGSHQALLFCRPPTFAIAANGVGRVEILSPHGSDVEAAANLFQSLRALDRENFAEILAFGGPEVGLYRAINDRLRRAAAQRP